MAIIIPPARKQLSVLLVVVLSALTSILFRYVLTAVSSGFAVIISAVVASAVGALLFPVKDTEDGQQ